ncbi:sensor histidine kinase [Leptospira sp. 96542]|nr:sensor histidine kinase [Leptospira sp. 96542]
MKFLILILISGLCGCIPIDKTTEIPVAKDGIIDLRNWEFGNSPSVPLAGEWDFFWNEFINPTENHPSQNNQFFFEGNAANRNFQQIGDRWKNQHKGIGFATYRLNVLLPETKENKSFGIRFFQTGGAAFKIFINGKLELELGKVGKTREVMSPTRSSGILLIPESDHRIEILIQISNFYHDDGAFWYPPNFGNYEFLYKQIITDAIIDSLLTGALFFMAFYHFVVFIFRRNRSLLLYFGLYSFCIALHSISLNGDTLYFLFPNVQYRFAFSISLVFYLAMAFYLLFLIKLFPNHFSQKIVNLFSAVLFLLFLIVLFFPTEKGSLTTFYGLFFSIFGLFYSVYCLTVASIKKEKLARVLLLIQVVLLLTAINDTLVLYGILHYKLVMKYSYLSTVLFQSLVLASFFTKSFIKIETLSKELSTLNESLEKTVLLRTEEYKIAKQIAEEANEWKDKFISLVAHDLRSPLSTVYSALNFTMEEDTKEDEKKHIFNQLFVILENAMSTVEHLLNLNRFQKGKIHLNLSSVSLLKIIKILSDSFSFELRKKSLQLNLSVTKNDTVYADETILAEVIRNIVSNAIKFSNQNGIIKISYHSTENTNLITIEDNGQGIAPNILKELFSRQTTTQGTLGEKGFGIGLKLCFELMRLHEGNIQVESELNIGSKFILEFPKSQDDDNENPKIE